MIDLTRQSITKHTSNRQLDSKLKAPAMLIMNPHNPYLKSKVLDLVNMKRFPSSTCMPINLMSQCIYPHIPLHSTPRHEYDDIPRQPYTCNTVSFTAICRQLFSERILAMTLPYNERASHKSELVWGRGYERSSSTEVHPSQYIFGRTRYPKWGSRVVVWYINSEPTMSPLYT
jgi:hypothetical protein